MKRVIAILAIGMLGGAVLPAATIVQNNNAAALVGTILGPGLTLVGVPSVTGNALQFGTFTNGGATVLMPSGIVLSSGRVADISGPNLSDDDLSQDLSGSGDADLDAITIASTFDAALLEFQFQFGDGSGGGDLYFNFAFASDEYLEYVGTQFFDVFAFFVDGNNIALIGGVPITVDAINTTSNPGLYRDNPPNSGAINILADGITTVLTAQALGLGPGVHTMKIGIADTSDGIYDSAVFIEGGTFSSQPSAPSIPEPATLVLMGGGLLVLGLARRLRS